VDFVGFWIEFSGRAGYRLASPGDLLAGPPVERHADRPTDWPSSNAIVLAVREREQL
jgi:hypothetical protein